MVARSKNLPSVALIKCAYSRSLDNMGVDHSKNIRAGCILISCNDLFTTLVGKLEYLIRTRTGNRWFFFPLGFKPKHNVKQIVDFFFLFFAWHIPIYHSVCLLADSVGSFLKYIIILLTFSSRLWENWAIMMNGCRCVLPQMFLSQFESPAQPLPKVGFSYAQAESCYNRVANIFSVILCCCLSE